MAAPSGPDVPPPTFRSTSRTTATTLLGRPARQRVGLHRFGRTALVLGGLVATVALAMLVSLVVAGPTGEPIPPGTIAALAMRWMPFLHVPHVWSDTQATIVLQVRLPRTLTAVLAGAALSAAGTTFPGIFP